MRPMRIVVAALLVAASLICILEGASVRAQPAGSAGSGAAVFPQDDIAAAPECPICGMDRAKFAHSRVFVTYEDGTVYGTCSIHCAAIDMALRLGVAPVSIGVGDFDSRQLIDAEKAAWVLGGNLPGVMTGRAKWAFTTAEAAQAFIRLQGGERVDFEAALKAAYEDMYEDTRMIRRKRQTRKGGS
jgi:copper chaperone NosL